jgi:uncharacterized membrane protein YkoI
VRRTGLIIALCLGAIAISGCGGGSDSSSTETTTSQSAPQNAEASIEGYGEEASGSEREELLSAFHAHFAAIAQGDNEKTCESLPAKARESLKSLSNQTKKELSCPELLELLLSPDAKQIAKQQSEGEITKVRIEGDTAFIVFHAPGARLYQLTMVEEEGQWKATSLAASVLAPSLNR